MSANLQVARQFAGNLRRARADAGLTQEEVGFRTGLHRTEIGLLERGGRVPRIDTLIKLACALGLQIKCPLINGITWGAGTMEAAPGAFQFSADGDDDVPGRPT